jgi:hypothetical protein
MYVMYKYLNVASKWHHLYLLLCDLRHERAKSRTARPFKMHHGRGKVWSLELLSKYGLPTLSPQSVASLE